MYCFIREYKNMIDIQNACEIATKERNEPFVSAVTDVGRGFVVATTAKKGEVADVPPLLINKKTGKTESYFIPMHFAEIKQGKRCEIPAEYR